MMYNRVYGILFDKYGDAVIFLIVIAWIVGMHYFLIAGDTFTKTRFVVEGNYEFSVYREHS